MGYKSLPQPKIEPELLKMADVATLCGISRGTLTGLMRQKGFPRPIKLPSRCYRWKRSSIINWINSLEPVQS